MSVHIYPINDTETHTLTSECECRPEKDRNGYYVHNLFGDDTDKLQWTFEITDTNER